MLKCYVCGRHLGVRLLLPGGWACPQCYRRVFHGQISQVVDGRRAEVVLRTVNPVPEVRLRR
jgi:hypothetical protein